MPAPYLTLLTTVEHETEVRRSRFVCAVAPARSVEEAAAFIAERRREHAGASHNCSAYVIGQRVQKGDDDGEPGGTAGTPMVQALTGRGYNDVVAVVTRYFGGVLLGAGGLVRAYGSAVTETLDRAEPVRMVPARRVRVAVAHDQAGRVENDLRASRYAVEDVAYADRVTFSVAVGEDEVAAFADWVATLTAGRARVEPGEDVHVRA
ncbi:YigZ family protein [Actinomadura sp. ATCC 31491]|uniref:YigZ family protein n=1 Tax=Actinomadura luzonensis TaxID=2805427 RepID=A0ABT0FVI8_9ACTN|nr:YigZ family protein [Actinomadura luzonensis]MCK2216350.1 YigZ family protein [Actinomadura luzonensis]